MDTSAHPSLLPQSRPPAMVLSTSAPTAEVYAATCNPPRKAKRARVEADELHAARLVESARTTSIQRTHPLVPRPTNPQAIAPNNVRIRPAPVHVSYKDHMAAMRGTAPSNHHPTKNNTSGTIPAVASSSHLTSPPNASASANNGPPAIAPKKRGRKPGGAMSRSARESQRKINHSRIEKARRSKINDALDSLRRLVPSDYGKEGDGTAPVNGDVTPTTASASAPKASNKKEEKEREFKLDILERTVMFVQDLIEKVDRLERSGTGTSKGSESGLRLGASSQGTCVCGRPYGAGSRQRVEIVKEKKRASNGRDMPGDEEQDFDSANENDEGVDDEDDDEVTDDEDYVAKSKPSSNPHARGKEKNSADDVDMEDIPQGRAPRAHASNVDAGPKPNTGADRTHKVTNTTSVVRPSPSLSPAHTSTSISDASSNSNSYRPNPSSNTLTLPSISSWLGDISQYAPPPNHNHNRASASPSLFPRLASSYSSSSSSLSTSMHPPTTNIGLLTPALTNTSINSNGPSPRLAASPPMTVLSTATGGVAMTPPSPFSIGPSNSQVQAAGTSFNDWGSGTTTGKGYGKDRIPARGAPYTAPGALGMQKSFSAHAGPYAGTSRGQSQDSPSHSPTMSMLPPPASPHTLTAPDQNDTRFGSGSSANLPVGVNVSRKRSLDETERDDDMRDRQRQGNDRDRESPAAASRRFESFIRSPVLEATRSRTEERQGPTFADTDAKKKNVYPRSASARTSPIVNWTREDESAASLLLHMSTSPVVTLTRSGNGNGDGDVPELKLQPQTQTQMQTMAGREVADKVSFADVQSKSPNTYETLPPNSSNSISTSAPKPSPIIPLSPVSVLTATMGAHTPSSLLGIRPQAAAMPNTSTNTG